MKKFTALFFIILLTPILLSGFYKNYNKQYITTIEKRKISKFPKLFTDNKINNNYSVDFEKWLQDNIAFRPEIIKLYNKLFSKTSTKVLYGENGFLFYKQGNSVNLFKRNIQLSDKKIYKKIDDIIQVASQLNKSNIKFYWLIPPNKHTVYSEYFPQNIKRLEQASVLDQVINYINIHKLNKLIKIIDLRQNLEENKSKYPELYYKTDTHWNQVGAFVGHNRLIKYIQHDFKDINKILTIDDFNIKKSKTNGDLAKMLAQTIKSNEYNFEPKFTNKIVNKNINKQDFIAIAQKPITNKTAIIYRDSFFDNLHKFISPYFKQTTYITDKIKIEDLDSIKQQKPDLVIYESVERNV